MNDEEKSGNGNGGGGGNPLLAVALALLVAGGGGTYYFYNQYQRSQQELTQVRQSADEGLQADVEALVEEVGKLIELPSDETPTVATIRDTENLADHPFLSRGQAGDRLLIYTGESRMVLMYRPETGKIVAVGTVSIQETEGEEGLEGEEGEEGEEVPEDVVEGEEEVPAEEAPAEEEVDTGGEGE